MKILKKITSIILSTILLSTTVYAGNTGGNTSTFTATSAVTKAANVTDTLGKSNEQRLLTISKGTGVTSVTVKVDGTEISPVSGTTTYWINQGKTAVVSATYSSEYEANSGTGNYVMSEAKTASVTAKVSGYTVKWTSSLMPNNDVRYINKTNPSGSTSTSYGAKQIRYTRPDGTTATADPGSANSSGITIKKGSTVYLEMYAGSGSQDSVVNWCGLSGAYDYGNGGSLISVGYVPTGGITLSYRIDSYDSSNKYYRWYVTASAS